MSEYMAQMMDDQITGAMSENERLMLENRALAERCERLEGALRVALAAIDETCNEMTIGERFTNAGQSLLEALPACRDALSGSSGGKDG